MPRRKNAVKASVPAGSLAIETRRLLRHLDTPKHLRLNTLVAHVFEEHPEDRALSAIRSIVHRALDAMVDAARYAKRERTLRFRTIVTRYDLGGEPACAVARDLGLSMRHFYRERHAACVEVGTFVRRMLPGRSCLQVTSDVYEVSESAAHAIYLAGAPERSLEQFLTLASSASELLSRVAALCDAAMIMIELYDITGARRVIAEAERLAEEADGLSPAAREEVRDLLDFARALSLWDADEAEGAVGLALHTMQRAHRYINELSVSGLRVHAGERLRYAGRCLAAGNSMPAMQLIHESEPYIDLLRQRVPYLRIDYANIRCGIELRMPGPWDEAARLASNAYDESRKQGYLVGAATAAKSMAIILARNGDVRATELADAVLEFARNNNSPRLLAYAQIGAAEVYELVEYHERALALARSATEALHGEELQLARARMVQARALWGLRGAKNPKLPRL